MIFKMETFLCQFPILLQAGAGIDIAAGADRGGAGDIIFNILMGVGLLATIVIAGYFAARFYRAKSAVPSRKQPQPVDTLARATRARVQKAMNRGEYEVAGDLLAHAGIHDDAAAAYAEAGALAKAARSFQVHGDFQKAIHYYKRAGDFEMTARLYVESGEHRAAAAEFLQAKNYAAAAAQYEASKDPQRAAENYEKVRQFRSAAINYEQCEEPLKAAECYEAYFAAHWDDALDSSEGADPKLTEAAQRAGELWQDAGQPDLAADIFYRVGLLAQAAECLRANGDFARAADWFLEARQPLKAAEALEESGDLERAAKMRAEAALKGGDRRAAAEMLAQAGEVERAADIFEGIGEFEQAAALFETLGEHVRAADLYQKVEQHGLEARCAELAGLTSRAADAYRRAGDVESEIRLRIQQGDYFRAGRLLFEHRRFVEALEVLAKIDSANPIYLRALE